MTWRIDDPQGDESAKVKHLTVPYTRGVVLDMGCGPHKAFPHFIGVDSCKDTELFGIPIKPDVNCDVSDPAAIEATFQPEGADAIFSSHCLEHIEDHHAALKAWWSLLKVGGHLVLYLPHRDLYPNIGEHGANPDHKHDFVAEDILHAMVDFDFDVLVNETRDEGFEYSFLLVLKKLDTPLTGLFSYVKDREARELQREHGVGRVCVVRYGGFGDMIQTAAILPALKREGFHVTVMTTPKGQDVLAHDPHVDAWIIQDQDQVPNQWLSDYWRAWEPRFDRFVNLCESIEGSLLTIPGRANHHWPEATRRRLFGVNYNEWTAELAQVPFAPEGRFYPSHDEASQSQRYLAHVKERMGTIKPRNSAQQIMGLMPKQGARENVPIIRPVFNVLWTLAGSSVHKFYPHMDAVIARMLTDWPEAAIHLVGDEACQILEAGWENEPRVFRQSGLMNIRQTMTLARDCDLVVGPETGVLNAVAFEENFKVVLLSHSSFENLPKHWNNAIGIEPNREVAPCYPCHRLHYDRTYCPEHKATGASMCSVSIMPGSVFDACSVAYRKWKGIIPIARALEAA